jgi:hypothetical protein
MVVSGQLHVPATLRPDTHCIGGRVDPRLGLITVEKRKFSCPFWKSNPNSSVTYPKTNNYID